MHDWQSEVRARLKPLRLRPEREADIVGEVLCDLVDDVGLALRPQLQRLEPRAHFALPVMHAPLP